jgi:hypothetical protein
MSTGELEAVIAPGPRLNGPPAWNERHREFHVRPGSVIARSGAHLDASGRALVYRVQLGLTFEPTGRATPPGRILGCAADCRLVLELLDMNGLHIGWEGPRWHLRYAEGAAFDGSCVVGQPRRLDEVRDGDTIQVVSSRRSIRIDWAAVADFAAFVNRYVALGPRLLVLAGWPLGPTLRPSAGRPELEAGGSARFAGRSIWASHSLLGRVGCTVGGTA